MCDGASVYISVSLQVLVQRKLAVLPGPQWHQLPSGHGQSQMSLLLVSVHVGSSRRSTWFHCHNSQEWNHINHSGFFLSYSFLCRSLLDAATNWFTWTWLGTLSVTGKLQLPSSGNHQWKWVLPHLCSPAEVWGCFNDTEHLKMMWKEKYNTSASQ